MGGWPLLLLFLCPSLVHTDRSSLTLNKSPESSPFQLLLLLLHRALSSPAQHNTLLLTSRPMSNCSQKPPTKL